ncbi:MAG: Xaa-Pro dipeptidyl-peptidase [Planctomycetota bacterium]
MNAPRTSVRVLTLVSAALAAARAPAQDAEKAVPVFKDGQAQVVDAFKNPRDWIHERLWVQADFDSDGDGKPDRLHVDVTRPKQTDTEGLKVPVVYETSPYYAGTGTGGPGMPSYWDPKQELGEDSPPRTPMDPIPFQQKRPFVANSEVRSWVPRGFAVVHSDSPGTGLSQGCPTVGGTNEAMAPKAVIDWLNGRAKGYTTIDGNEEVEATGWCTGKVGMTGTSYNGTLPCAAASTGVEGLEAIIPISPNTSYYEYYRCNGLVRSPGGYLGEDMDALYDFINSGDPNRREWCNKHVRDEDLDAHMDRKTGDSSEWWQHRDYLLQMSKWHAATLMAHGFNDWNVMPDHTVRIYAALKRMNVPHMAYFHQGGHGGPPPFELMNKWFTRYLFGVENDVEKEPRAWIVREGDRRDKPTPYADYPNPAAEMVKLSLTKGGNEQGGLGFATMNGVVHEKLVDDVSIEGAELAKAEKSEHRLLYATKELQEPVHLSGTSTIKIRMACSKPATNLSVWMVSLPWEGSRDRNANIITRGWADPQNRDSLTKSEPLVPGEFVDVTFDLKPDDQIVPKGQRIALMIFASDREFTLWPKPGTEITVDLAGTTLTIPVVGGAKALQKAFGG